MNPFFLSTFASRLAAATVLTLICAVAAAQPYPNRPVRVVYARGGWVNVNNLTDLLDASGQ